MQELDLTISVVLYKNTVEEIDTLLHCIQQTALNYKLILIDNSPTDVLKSIGNNSNTEYIYNGQNIGFGKAQNIAISKAIGRSKYHLILNPDITFSKGTLENIYQFMEKHPDIGHTMPKVYYPNGEIQRLCKLLPHPIDLIGRRFLGKMAFMQKRNKLYELDNFSYDMLLDTPNLSGCFMFIRTTVLKKVNGFDSRYFMYLEDFDLTRRIHKISRTVFYPGASIVHGFGKGSYASLKLLRHHVVSAVKYFNKWGWFFDEERKRLNEKVCLQLKANDSQILEL